MGACRHADLPISHLTATYSYDANGNRTNAGYATGTGNRTINDGVWTYTYDAEGNVTKKSKGAFDETWEYDYDHRNQLTGAAFSATDGGSVTTQVTYVYDALGNRIERAAWDGTSTTVERYAYDGWDTAKPRPMGNEQFDVFLDLDGTNDLTMRRLHGPGTNSVSNANGFLNRLLLVNTKRRRYRPLGGTWGGTGRPCSMPRSQTKNSSGNSGRYHRGSDLPIKGSEVALKRLRPAFPSDPGKRA